MLSLGKGKSKSPEADAIFTENKDLKKQMKTLQETIENNTKTTKDKDDQIQKLDDEMRNMKDTILHLTSNLDTLQSKQHSTNDKISQKEKRIAEYKATGPLSRCPNMHLLQPFDASNIDTCSQCGIKAVSGEQMRRCRICNYNKCNKCYNSKPNSATHKQKTKTNKNISKKQQKLVVISSSQKSNSGITLKSERGWIQLKNVPHNDFSEAVQINLSEFVLAMKKGIYKYNRKGWKLYIKYPSGYKGPYENTSAYSAKGFKGNMFDKCTLSMDRNKQILYMFTKARNSGRMAEINMKNKKFEIRKDLKSAGDQPVSLLIDSRVHIFGGDYFHLLWNPFVQSLKCVEGFGDIKKRKKNYFGVVYIERSNRILLFGGISRYSSQTSDIWEYIFDEHLWIKCGNLPKALSHFAWIITKDEKYIVVFDGSKDILIFDVDSMTSKISPKKMPFTVASRNNRSGVAGGINAMLMDNSGKFEILLRGYVRREFDKSIGNDVIYLILLWSMTNDIHLFNKSNGEHWKIDVETVLGFFEADNKGYNK